MVRTHLWFMRHGEVESPYVGSFVGDLDIGLSDLGRHQAAAIGAFLEDAGVDAVLSSPKARAMQTAVPLAEAVGLKPEVKRDLREMHFGEWEGRPWPDIEAADPDFAAKWQGDPGHIACPGGETANGFAARAQAAWSDIVAEFAGRHVAVFSHAGTNRAFVAAVTGRPYLESFAFAQDYGCVNAGAWQGQGGQIAMLNFVPGPRSEAHGDGGRALE